MKMLFLREQESTASSIQSSKNDVIENDDTTTGNLQNQLKHICKKNFSMNNYICHEDFVILDKVC